MARNSLLYGHSFDHPGQTAQNYIYIYIYVYIYIAMWPQNEMNESILSLNTVVDSLIIHCYIQSVSPL